MNHNKSHDTQHNLNNSVKPISSSILELFNNYFFKKKTIINIITPTKNNNNNKINNLCNFHFVCWRKSAINTRSLRRLRVSRSYEALSRILYGRKFGYNVSDLLERQDTWRRYRLKKKKMS